jgi:hypothetical protein
MLALLAAFALGAEPADDAAKLKDSLAKWEKAKDECGGDYSYTVMWQSAFGFGGTTTVTVKGNKLIGRKYETFKQDGGKREIKAEWAEEGEKIGTHKDGAAAKTVDDLYADAKAVAEAKPAEGHVRQLGLTEDGLLQYCFTRDTRIADDAPLEGVKPFMLTTKKKEK